MKSFFQKMLVITIAFAMSSLVQTTMAATSDPLGDLISNLGNKPTTQTTNFPDGTRVTTNSIPGMSSDVSFGTIYYPNGTNENIRIETDSNSNSTYYNSQGSSISFGLTTQKDTVKVVKDSSGNTTYFDSNGQQITDPGSISQIGVSGSNTSQESTETKIIVSEPVPGFNCVCYSDGPDKGKPQCTGAVETRKYECTVKKGLASFQDMLGTFIRYAINIVLILGVLGIVGLGIAWSIAGGDDAKAKGNLKKWTVNLIVGLILLFLFSQILRLLAPWVYK